MGGASERLKRCIGSGLCESFPFFYALADSKESLVADIWDASPNSSDFSMIRR